MRRMILSTLALLYSIIACCQKDNLTVSSKIEKVTVFLQGAQVERSASQQLAAGKYNIVFSGISPRIIKQSIQLKAEGQLTVLSVTNQVNFLKEKQVQEEIKKLETLKEQWLEKIALEKNMKNVYAQEEQLLLKNQAIKGDNATLKAAELKEAADFQRLRLTEVYQQLQDNETHLKKMELELAKLNKQLTELNQEKDLSTSEVIVAVDVKTATMASFRLTYLVKQAAWFPTYDVRVQDISQPIALQMKANIHQQSGEDWKEVKLFLSTGNPDENSSKPLLSPWYLRYYYPAPANALRIRGTSSISTTANDAYLNPGITGTVRNDKGEIMAGVSILAKGTNTGTVSDGSGNFTLSLPPGVTTINVSAVGYTTQELAVRSGYANVVLQPVNESLDEVVVVGYGTSSRDSEEWPAEEKTFKRKKPETAINTTTFYQPTTTVFEITDPYTVPDDGKLYTAAINSYELNAQYEYYTVPKLDANAYLTAKVTDWQELNLLPGEANLFFEGTYLGNSLLDVMNAGDTLNLSLGRDKGVVVKRTLLKEFSSKKFLGSNKTDSRQYEITIRNNKQLPVNIIIEDQFPLSTNKDIEVDKLVYDKGKLDEDTRKVSWTLRIDSKQENKLQLGYVVKYPKDKILQLE